MSPNVLRQFLELYDKQGMGAQGGGYNSGFDPYGVLDHANKMNAENSAGAMLMQQRMAGSGDGGGEPAPNFFANAQQAAYQQPEQFRYDPARDAMPGSQMPPDPMMGRGSPVRNYLARGGRYGY